MSRADPQTPRRVVLLEHYSSLPAGSAPPALVRAGAAILSAVAADLAAVPGVRAENIGPCRDRDAQFRRALRRSEAALVIAPEACGVLERFAWEVERSGRLFLGPGPRSVHLAADKRRTAAYLTRRGIAAPAGAVLAHSQARARLRRRPVPFVLKPRDGCGGVGASVVRRPDQIGVALRRLKEATRRDLLVEEYVPGEAASVAFLVQGRSRLLCLGFNRQHLVGGDLVGGHLGGGDVGGGSDLEYLGGETPYAHPLRPAAVAVAAAAVAAIAEAAFDLRGYVGVDLALAPDGPRVIEINPRLTTSYLGLRRVIGANLAGLMLDAAGGRPLPDSLPSNGWCRYAADGAIDREEPCLSAAAGTLAGSISR